MDRPLTLVKSVWLDDWYSIEWATHANQQWLEATGPQSASLRYSGRISDACVEGTAAEMQQIADGIEQRVAVHFRRCAFHPLPDGGGELWSPRNSQTPAVISAAQAQHLLVEMRKVLGAESPVVAETV